MNDTRIVIETMFAQFLIYGVWMVPLTILSGGVTYYLDVARQRRKSNYKACLMEMFIVSPTAGLMALLACLYMEADLILTAMVVSMASSRGANAFEIAWTIGLASISKRTGVSLTDLKDAMKKDLPKDSDKKDDTEKRGAKDDRSDDDSEG